MGLILDSTVLIGSERKGLTVRRTLAECIAMLPEDSTATIDEDFAKDVEAAIKSHREPADASAWD